MSAAAILALGLPGLAPCEGVHGANRATSSDARSPKRPRGKIRERSYVNYRMSITENDPVVRPWYGESEKRTDFA